METIVKYVYTIVLLNYVIIAMIKVIIHLAKRDAQCKQALIQK